MRRDPRTVGGFFVADGAEPTLFRFEAPLPEFPDMRTYQENYRQTYTASAERFVTELLKVAPGGFVDAVFADLAQRKACLFRVPLGAGHGR